MGGTFIGGGVLSLLFMGFNKSFEFLDSFWDVCERRWPLVRLVTRLPFRVIKDEALFALIALGDDASCWVRGPH